MSLTKFNKAALAISLMVGVVSLMIVTFIAPPSVHAESQLPAYTMSATPKTGTGPLTVVFTFPGGGFNTGGYWTLHYGDGQSENIIVPADFSGTIQKTHVYQSAGTYNAKVVDSNRPDLEIPYANTTITVTAASQLSTATISATPNSGNAPLTVIFTTKTGSSSGGNFTLNYGDGSSETLAFPADAPNLTASKSHTYQSAGTYTIKLSDSKSELARTTVTVKEVTTSYATLTASPSSGSAPLAVTLKAKTGSSNGGSFTLNYGDGSSETLNFPADAPNNTMSKTHTYQAAGTYTATLSDGKTEVERTTIRVTGTEVDEEDDEEEEDLKQQLITLIQLLLKQLQDRGTPVSLDSSTNTGTATCVNITSPLYVGSSDGTTNGDVTRLQNFLRLTGDFTYGEVTGYYGQATLQAVQKWQARNGVVSSGTPAATGFGLVGAATRIAMSCQ